MKSIFYPVVLLLAVSCAKEINPALTSKTVAAKSTDSSNYVSLLTGVYTYQDGGFDTTVTPSKFDSIYYTSDLKIDKVVSFIYQYSEPDTVSTQFVYNTDGSIDSLKMTSNDLGYVMNYLFYYDSNGRLDSLSAVYANNYTVQWYLNFSYDANGHIQHVYNNNGYHAYANNAYYHRSASGGLDSVQQDLTSEAYTRHTAIRPGSGIVLSSTAIDRSYLFLMGLKFLSVIPVNQDVNVYWHQYLNPDISLYRSGTYQRTNISGQISDPFDYNFERQDNVDGTVRWLGIKRYSDTSSYYERRDKFVYGKVPTTGSSFN